MTIFCSNYLVLNAQEATLFDLFRILFSRKLYRRNFFEIPEVEEIRELEHRWIIFISVLLQKLLLYGKTPLAKIGNILEEVLNLLSSNGGLLRLILNLYLGKVVKAERSSDKFRSLVGQLDRRTELDRNIKNGSSRYYSALSIMAAKLSYENEAFVQNIVKNNWKASFFWDSKLLNFLDFLQMEFIGFYNFWNDYQELYSTQAIMFQDTTTTDQSDLIVVAFRGTDPFDANAWITDVDLSWYELQGVGKVHAGFMKALGMQKSKGWPKDIIQKARDHKSFAYYTIREKLRAILEKNENAKFILTGHSLGGALAILFAALLVLHEEEWLLERLEGVFTFGQPRVGNGQFGEFMKEKMGVYGVRYLRYVYCNDMVPRLPYDDKTTLFKHFGPCLYFNSCYRGKVLGEEPNKNYFSLLWAIPKSLNAAWELIRSFILPWTKGAEYAEGWFLRFYRVIGMLIPGLSAHAPEDYVNLTRLGSDISSHILQEQTNTGNGLKNE